MSDFIRVKIEITLETGYPNSPTSTTYLFNKMHVICVDDKSNEVFLSPDAVAIIETGKRKIKSIKILNGKDSL